MFSRMVAIALMVAALPPSIAEPLTLRAEISGGMPNPLSLKSVLSDSTMELREEYLIGDPAAHQKTHVKIFVSSDQSSSSSLAKRDTASKNPLNDGRRIDLTPAECTSQACYPGSFRGPEKTDCDVIVAAQLYNSTGSLTAAPGKYVLVYSGTCVVVFQHPIGKPEYNYTFDYNWASLGKIMQSLAKTCMSKPESQSIGGACIIDHYLKYKFENVLISLQRYVESDKKKLDS